jgi:hypothetical protein
MSKHRILEPLLEENGSSLDGDGRRVRSSAERPARQAEMPGKRSALFGLVKRKEKWTLSTRGRLASLAIVLILGAAFVCWIHPFLAVTDPVDSRYLVIEGWIPNYALEESIAEFKSKPYQMIFTVGADPLTGVNIEEGDSVAIEAYNRLKWLGMNPDLIKPVPAHIKYRNRTFESAVALRKWIEENNIPVNSINVVTLGAHARRSRLLFEEAFEGHARVGIIAVENREYDPKRWWKYSEGVREVIGEGIGYLYARVFFHPGKQ